MFQARCFCALMIAVVTLLTGRALGQAVTFTTPTTIGDGDLSYEGYHVTVQGTTLTVDGAHTFASLTVVRSLANQPGVVTHSVGFDNGTVAGMHLTISGNVLVEGASGALVASRIDASGRGFAGGTGPGAGGNGAQAGGGGHGGFGGLSNGGGGTPGIAYGLVSSPQLLGSGGGNDTNGGGPGGRGGGAIRLSIGGTLTLDGTVSAVGQNGPALETGGGAGGSVWILASTLQGSGAISADGGSGNTSWSGGGSGGRVAVHAGTNAFTGPITSCGGGGYSRGAAGTVLVRSGAQTRGALTVANCGPGMQTRLDEFMDYDSVLVGSSAVLELLAGTTLSADGLTVANTGTITHAASDASGLHLDVAGALTIEAGGAVTASGRGHPGNSGPGAGGAAPQAGGGGHGGYGGDGNGGGAGGAGYGSVAEPTTPGSGGGLDTNAGHNGGAGGGVIRLSVGGALAIDGAVLSAGAPGVGNEPGAGAGGSIWIDAGSVTGSGAISAPGGNANVTWAGGGGGGRIAVHYGTYTFTGTVTACGGTGYHKGGAGTVLFQSGAQAHGDLVLGNCNLGNNAITDLPVPIHYDSITVRDRALLDLPAPVTVHAGDLLVTSAGMIRHWATRAGLHLLIDDDMTIDPGASIDLDWRGHAPGAGPGVGGAGAQAGGGGHGGSGGNANDGGAGGIAHGSPIAPTDLGSGGGEDTNAAGVQAGAGGGAVRLDVAGTLTVNGLMTAGGQGVLGFEGGAGAGGSIWIDAGTLEGAGVIRANGGNGNNSYSGGGGGGRIALYYASNSFTGTVTAFGGAGYRRGGAGTIVYKPDADPYPHLITNAGAVAPAAFTTISAPVDWGNVSVVGGSNTFFAEEVTIHGAAGVSSGSDLTFEGSNLIMGDLSVGPTGRVTHRPQVPGMHLTVQGNVTVDGGGAFEANGRGHPSESGPGAGVSGAQASGGGHGGLGGAANGGGGGGAAYGSVVAPVELGSGGGRDVNAGIPGGPGGGALRLTVGGTLTLEGAMSVNGLGSGGFEPGAGSGGSLWVSAGHLQGAGAMTAHGGNENTSWSGAGGGGRIAVYYTSSSFTGTMAAFGGDAWRDGGAGTVYTKAAADNLGDLRVVNGRAGALTPMPVDVTVIGDVTVDGQAELLVDHALDVDSLTVTNAAVTHTAQAPSGLRLNAQGSITVGVGGLITANGKGFGASTGPGEGIDAAQASGAGYGGAGGNGNPSTPGGTPYGSLVAPFELGSGGGNDTNAGIPGGAGGGRIHLELNGALHVDGQVTARGGDHPSFESGGGSGGTIHIKAGSITGTGSIRAIGGNGNGSWSGGGGGGRIAIYVPTGGMVMPASNVLVTGGSGWRPGGRGTIYWPTVCPADANGNGSYETGDVTAFLALWFADLANGTIYSDVNGSGNVTTADISFFLSGWFNALNGTGC